VSAISRNMLVITHEHTEFTNTCYKSERMGQLLADQLQNYYNYRDYLGEPVPER